MNTTMNKDGQTVSKSTLYYRQHPEARELHRTQECIRHLMKQGFTVIPPEGWVIVGGKLFEEGQVIANDNANT